MSICPICGCEVSMAPWLLENVLYVRCKHCKKEWHIDDSDGKGEELWKMVCKIEVKKNERTD